MTNSTVKQLVATMLQELSPLYPLHEAEAMIYLTIKHVLNLSRSDIYLKPDTNVPKTELFKIEKITGALKKFEPLQYILGETSFYGLDFRVNSNVLIPRPETEELVDWVLKENPQPGLKAIDLGTGSGCIAVATAKNRPSWEVLAVDISPGALEIAARNSAENKTQVTFMQADILNISAELSGREFDIIMSNPPYVTPGQKNEMLPNVLDYEPHLALFAPGTDALIFYRCIAGFASSTLSLHGKVYVEINELFPNETARIFDDERFKTKLKKDIHGKYRMLKAYKND